MGKIFIMYAHFDERGLHTERIEKSISRSATIPKEPLFKQLSKVLRV